MVAKSIERNMKNKKLSHIAFAIAGILCTSNVWTQTAIKPVYANQVSVYTTAERNNRQMVEAKKFTFSRVSGAKYRNNFDRS